ncbi:MAG: hypothetical protein K2K34_03255 [Oscillospiraceae bacterium]|nr:hypothetical protein [Oscillospiraceae bacterium]
MKRYRFLAGILFLCTLSAAVLTSCKEDTDSLPGEAFTASETVSAVETSAIETEAVSENTAEDITPEPLSADAEKKLIADYATFIGIDSDNNWISVEDYYGTYSGCEAVIMYHGAGMTDDEKEIIVAGYTFWFSSGSYDFRLHKDSSFIDINTAYDEGYLTDEDIDRIYQNYLNSSNR